MLAPCQCGLLLSVGHSSIVTEDALKGYSGNAVLGFLDIPFFIYCDIVRYDRKVHGHFKKVRIHMR